MHYTALIALPDNGFEHVLARSARHEFSLIARPAASMSTASIATCVSVGIGSRANKLPGALSWLMIDAQDTCAVLTIYALERQPTGHFRTAAHPAAVRAPDHCLLTASVTSWQRPLGG